MKSELRIKKRGQLIRLYRRMTPENRLIAFLNHSRLVCRLAKTGEFFRLSSQK